jgi:hypothetical protein
MFPRSSSDHEKTTVNRKPVPAGPSGGKPPAKNSLWQSLALRRDSVQPKLSVSQPGDVAEQQADQVADQVMKTPESQVQRSACACGGTCPKCQGEQHEVVQAKPLEPTHGTTAIDSGVVQQSLNSAGRPLDAGTRGIMEARFGQDFNNVRVHSDGEAAQAARGMDARAFTTGRDIVFGAGEYQPASAEGQRLLAHELTHVMQQAASGSAIHRKPATPAKPAAPSWTVAQLTGMLDKCDGGLGIRAKAKAANNNKDPTIVPGDDNYVETQIGQITLERSQDKCTAVQVLVQELSNLSRKAAFESLDTSARAGDVARDDYIKRTELIEYETGVQNVLTAFDACKDQWPCPTAEKEWARPAKDFQDYYDNYLSGKHKASYGEWWDSNARDAYQKKHAKGGAGAPAAPAGAPAQPDAMEHVAGGLWATNEKGEILPPALDDIKQGGLADCYLFAALAAIVNTHPENIVSMIYDHGDDSYTVTFKGVFNFWSEAKEKVTADFPVGKHGYVGSRKAIWPLVIEKAYAQEKGGTDKIGSGGYSGTVIDDLLNVSASSFNPQEKTADYIMAKVLKAKQEKWPMTIYSPKKDDASAEKKQLADGTPGLYFWHAYTIVDVDGQGNRLKLFNPWGHDHPNGDGWISVEKAKQFFVGLQING